MFLCTVLETVEQAGVLGRAWDAVRLWVQLTGIELF
jgi:hypothetical protein